MENLGNQLYRIIDDAKSALFDQGADVHMALPDYRTIFNDCVPPLVKKGRKSVTQRMPSDRIHLAEDRAFYYLDRV